MQPWSPNIRILLLSILLHWAASGQFQVKGPQTPVIASLDQEALLHCYLSPSMDASNMNITWYHGQSDFVYAYRNGKEYMEGQAPEYQDRTTLLMENIENGHVQLKIYPIKLSDGGMYRCIFKSPTHFDVARITVLVTDALNSSISSQSVRLAACVIILAVCLTTTCMIYVFSKLSKENKKAVSGNLIYEHVKSVPAKKDVPQRS